MGDEYSDSFEVTTDMIATRMPFVQVFFLYINFLLDMLEEACVGVECRGQRIAALS